MRRGTAGADSVLVEPYITAAETKKSPTRGRQPESRPGPANGGPRVGARNVKQLHHCGQMQEIPTQRPARRRRVMTISRPTLWPDASPSSLLNRKCSPR